MDYVDVQVSIDGASAEVNDAVRGRGPSTPPSPRCASSATRGSAGSRCPSSSPVRTSASSTSSSLAARFGAQLRLTRLRPSGRGVGELGRAAADGRSRTATCYHWLCDHPDTLTGDSFFHLSALGEPLDGLNLCGAGRVVCLVDPIGDVYACPFAIHEQFFAGSVRERAASPRCGATRRCSPRSVRRGAPARARRAAPGTRAVAGAWRRSSSRACRSTARTPTASTATATPGGPQAVRLASRPHRDHTRSAAAASAAT